jgi:hypothetical protein
MENRIYLVSTSTGIDRLIEAPSKNVALSYAVKSSMTIELASQSKLVQLVREGVEVETLESSVISQGE